MSGTLQLFFNFCLFIVGGFLVIYVGYYKIILFFFKPHYQPKPYPKLFSLQDRVVEGIIKVQFMVPESMPIKISIKQKGDLLKVLKDAIYENGTYEVDLNTVEFDNGDYVLCLESNLVVLQRSLTIKNS